MTLIKYMILALLVCAAVSSPVRDIVNGGSESVAAEGEDLLASLVSHLQRRVARGSRSGSGAASAAANGLNAVVNVAAGSHSQGGPYYNGNSGSGDGTHLSAQGNGYAETESSGYYAQGGERGNGGAGDSGGSASLNDGSNSSGDGSRASRPCPSASTTPSPTTTTTTVTPP